MHISLEPSEIPKAKLSDRTEIAKVYARVFSTKDGRIVLEDLAGFSGMYRTNFVQSNSDYTNFLEGHRALFLYICSQATEEQQIDNIEGKL